MQLDTDLGPTYMIHRTVASEVLAFANAKKLYEAMMVTAFGTPSELEAIRNHVRRDMSRIRTLLSGSHGSDEEPDADSDGERDTGLDGGCVTELIDRMIHRSLFESLGECKRRM